MTTLMSGLVRPHLVEMTKREDNPNAPSSTPAVDGLRLHPRQLARRMLLSSLRGGRLGRSAGRVCTSTDHPWGGRGRAQIIQRLKQLMLVLVRTWTKGPAYQQDKAGPCTRRHQSAQRVTIVNPDQLLFTVQDDRDVGGELYVNKGAATSSRAAP